MTNTCTYVLAKCMWVKRCERKPTITTRARALAGASWRAVAQLSSARTAVASGAAACVGPVAVDAAAPIHFLTVAPLGAVVFSIDVVFAVRPSRQCRGFAAARFPSRVVAAH